ncbi:hypothetical protein ACX4MU_12505, partial [Roseomonas mucosa]
QRSGAGQRLASLVFDPRIVSPAALRGWLEAQLGPLAALQVDPPARPDVRANRPPADFPAAENSSGRSGEMLGNQVVPILPVTGFPPPENPQGLVPRIPERPPPRHA